MRINQISMTRSVLKKKIHNCVDNINDEKLLEAVYTILNEHVSHTEFELSAEDIKIINARKKAILNGDEKVFTVAETKKKLLKNLGK